MSQGELGNRSGLRVRVTFESGRLSGEHLADAYELILPPVRRRAMAGGRLHLIHRREVLQHQEEARAC